MKLSAITSNDPAAFALTLGGPTPCGSFTPVLAAGTSCSMVVTFTPTTFGSKKAMLVVMPDVVGSTVFTAFNASVQQSDITPDFLSFNWQQGVPRNTAVVSNSVVVTGLDVPVNISIVGGEYSINGGAFTASPGTIQNGQSVVVRVMSSPNHYTGTTATLFVGSGSANFNVETLGPTFTTVYGSSQSPSPGVIKMGVPDSLVVWEGMTISGSDGPFPISISGGEYSIDGAPFTTAAGTIQNNQTVVVRQRASSSFDAQTVVTLSIASRFGNFYVRTPNQTPPPVMTYFPLAIGNSWLVRRNGVVGTASTITDAQVIYNAAAYGVPDGFDGSVSYFSNDGQLGIRLHRAYFPATFIEGCGIVSETDNYEPPLTIIPGSVNVGQSIPSSGQVSASAPGCATISSAYTANSALESIERVSVAAGQFDALRLRLTLSLPVYGVTNSVVLWFAQGVGQLKAQYDDGTIDELVSTNVVRTIPDGIVFASQFNVPSNSTVISNPITVSGITAPAAVAVTGGEYSINGGAFTSLPGSVSNGQNIRLRLRSPVQGGANGAANISVGGVVGTFNVTTGVGGPSAPTSVTAQAGFGSVTVTFVAPANNGGATITGYTATCTSSNGGVERSFSFGATTTSVQIGGLTNGRSYTCTVTANNSLGAGEVSAPSSLVVPIDITPILNLLLMDE